MKIITPKEFAQMFTATRNAVESAIRLGISPLKARTEGTKMLCDKKVQREIKKLDKNDIQTLTYVKTGLSRLAFGSVNDVVSIIFDEQPTVHKIMQADLFNVSEIKRVKGGGVEVKFFDRQKALEKLVELDPELKDVSDAQQFLQAVYSGSQGDISSLIGEESDNEDDTE